MLTKHRIVNVVVVLSATVTLACSERAGSPTAPSSLASTSSQPTVQVSPAQPSEVWNITMRLETASGNECVAETMQSEIGVPKSYTLSVARKGEATVNVTLRSASGDYACTFPAMAEPDGFTTVGVPGWLSCEAPGLIRGFRCSDGTLRDLMSFGENISGRISGTEITGNWSVSWIVIRAGGDLGGMDDVGSVETVAQFNGRQ